MAVAAHQQRWITLEDLMQPGMPEKGIELVEGELIEMTPPTWRHGDIAMNLFEIFTRHALQNPELKACTEGQGFAVSRQPASLLMPDAALFRRRPPSPLPWYDFAPELVVEVLFPSNSDAEMALKRHRYFDAGTEQVWMVDYSALTVRVHHHDGRIIEYNGDSVLEGEGIVSGLQVPLEEVFRER